MFDPTDDDTREFLQTFIFKLNNLHIPFLELSTHDIEGAYRDTLDEIAESKLEEELDRKSKGL